MKLNTLLVFLIVGFLILPACTATPTPIADQTSDYEEFSQPDLRACYRYRDFLANCYSSNFCANGDGGKSANLRLCF